LAIRRPAAHIHDAGIGASRNATAIEVIIQQPQPRFFSGLFLAGNPTVSARAVAIDPPGTGSPCVLALSRTANPGITFSGGSNVNSPSCDIISDSNVTSGNDSAELSGSATVTTACLVAVGTVDESGNSTLNLTKCTTPTTHAQPVADPYLGVTDPPPMPANQGSCTNGPGNTVNCTCPGGACYYTNDPNPNGTATFAPGLYYFEQGFSVGGGTATGTDVPLSETNFFAIVIAIQSRTGGSLSGALGNLSAVLRDRQKMRDKAKALAGEAKASAGIIAAMPVLVAAALSVTSPKYIALLFTTHTGKIVLTGCAVMMTMGVMIMRKMINFEM
jgi:hypothetical protein